MADDDHGSNVAGLDLSAKSVSILELRTCTSAPNWKLKSLMVSSKVCSNCCTDLKRLRRTLVWMAAKVGFTLFELVRSDCEYAGCVEFGGCQERGRRTICPESMRGDGGPFRDVAFAYFDDRLPDRCQYSTIPLAREL